MRLVADIPEPLPPEGPGVPGERGLTLRATASGTAVRVHLCAPGGAEPLAFEVDVGRDPSIRCWQLGPTWSMVRGLPFRMPGGDVFSFANRWAYRVLRASGARGPEAWASLRAVYDALRRLACHLADACHPAARALALRFLPHLRFAAYRRFVQDPTGRVAQLAAASPGTFVFALALRERKDPDSANAGHRLLEDAIRGRPLDRALDDALDVWEAAGIECARTSLRDPPLRVNRAWERVADATRAERRRIRLAQRLLVRRAGTRVATTLLWLPPPLAFVPEDIPAKTMANSRWYRVMKETDICLHPGRPVEDTCRHELSAFLSANSEAFRKHARAASMLFPFLLATARHVSRTSSPAKVLDACARWDALQRRVRYLEAAAARRPSRVIPGAAVDLALPGGPVVETLSAGGLEARPITTAAQLYDEGERMHNCVARYLEAVMRRKSFIYAASIGRTRLTVEVGRREGTWVINLARGVANRVPTPGEDEALERWIAALNRVAEAKPAHGPGAA